MDEILVLVIMEKSGLGYSYFFVKEMYVLNKSTNL